MSGEAALARRDVEFRLALLYGAVFLIFGVQAPFIAVWLGTQGLSLAQIGVVLAAPRLLQALGVPIFARWADKRGEVTQMLAVSAILMTALFAALIFAKGVAAVLLTVGLLFSAQSGAMPLCDVLAFALFRSAEAAPGASPNFDYGRVRKWGSAAFIAGDVGGGLFLDATSISAVTIALAASAALAVGAAIYAAPLDAMAKPATPKAPDPAGAVGAGILGLVIGANVLIQASHVFANSFAAIHWTAQGHSTVFVGAVYAASVLGETLFFAFYGRWIFGTRQAAVLLAIGGATAVLRWVVMSLDPPAAILALAQLGHGFSFAASHVGAMLLIAELAPVGYRARAQGWMTAGAAGLGGALMPAFAPLYGRAGEGAYLAMAGVAAVGLCLALVAARSRRRALR